MGRVPKGKGDPWRHWLSLKTWNRLWCVIPYDTASDNGSAFQGRVPAIASPAGLFCRNGKGKLLTKYHPSSACSVAPPPRSAFLPRHPTRRAGSGIEPTQCLARVRAEASEDAGITLPIVLTGLGSGACSNGFGQARGRIGVGADHVDQGAPFGMSLQPQHGRVSPASISDLVDVGPPAVPGPRLLAKAEADGRTEGARRLATRMMLFKCMAISKGLTVDESGGMSRSGRRRS